MYVFTFLESGRKIDPSNFPHGPVPLTELLTPWSVDFEEIKNGGSVILQSLLVGDLQDAQMKTSFFSSAREWFQGIPREALTGTADLPRLIADLP